MASFEREWTCVRVDLLEGSDRIPDSWVVCVHDISIDCLSVGLICA